MQSFGQMNFKKREKRKKKKRKKKFTPCDLVSTTRNILIPHGASALYEVCILFNYNRN